MLTIKHFSIYSRQIIVHDPAIINAAQQLGIQHLFIDASTDSNLPMDYHYSLIIYSNHIPSLQLDPFGKYIYQDQAMESHDMTAISEQHPTLYHFNSATLTSIFPDLTFQEKVMLFDCYQSLNQSSDSLAFVGYGNHSASTFLWQLELIRNIFPNKSVIGIYIDFVLESSIESLGNTDSTIYSLHIDDQLAANFTSIFNAHQLTHINALFMEPSLADHSIFEHYIQWFQPYFHPSTPLIIRGKHSEFPILNGHHQFTPFDFNAPQNHRHYAFKTNQLLNDYDLLGFKLMSN